MGNTFDLYRKEIISKIELLKQVVVNAEQNISALDSEGHLNIDDYQSISGALEDSIFAIDELVSKHGGVGIEPLHDRITDINAALDEGITGNNLDELDEDLGDLEFDDDELDF